LIQTVLDSSISNYAFKKVSLFPATSSNPFLGRKRLEGERVKVKVLVFEI
jgi:hypothetical protein